MKLYPASWTRFAALVLLTAAPLARADAGPVVQTRDGALSGSIDATTHVSVFKGVPFAAPPVGELRWREPQPVTPWKGVRDATQFGRSPMQKVHGDFLPWTREYLVQNEVSEDCLYLNIWSPRVDSSARLPVLVYIPGGAFTEGSGEVPIYDGAHLASLGAIVITTNYRLGVFGFFAHPALSAESPHHVSGNYGLMDQVAALRWVKANIEAFGGDPTRVTVWGQSAGAASVAALLASPQARSTFDRAIADSGLTVGGGSSKTLADAEQAGASYGALHQAQSLKELRSLPAAELVKASRVGPIVDGWFLPDSPNAIDTKGGGNDVPVLTGYQANDSLLSLPHTASEEDYRKSVQQSFGPMAEQFTQLYPAKTVDGMREALLQGSRDRQRFGMYLWAKQRESSHHSPVYTYFFVRGIPWPEHAEYGAFHSGELPYFFGNLAVLPRPWQPIDHQISESSMRYILNFAATGNPNGINLPKWEAVRSDAPETLLIGEEIKQSAVVDPSKQHFWESFFESKERE